MKSSPSELISTLRKKISLHSAITLLLLAMMMIALMIYPKDISPFFEGVISGAFLVFAFMGYMIIRRRISCLKFLDPSQPQDSIEKFESYLEDEQKSFREFDVVRWILGIALTLAMLAFIFYSPHSRFTGQICTIWFGLILLSMFKSWTLMRDGMALQDLKHSSRNQASDIS
jgi:hypothetical protein